MISRWNNFVIPVHIYIIKKDVGFYLLKRARTWVNNVSFVPYNPSIQGPQLGTPYSRSARFDTDIAAFNESSVVGLQEGLMVCLVISEEICNKDVFVRGQIFAFGSIVLHAEPASHLGQVESFTPVRKSRSGA